MLRLSKRAAPLLFKTRARRAYRVFNNEPNGPNVRATSRSAIPALAKKCAELGENGPERSNVEIVADHQAAATAS